MDNIKNKIYKDTHERLIPDESPFLNKKMLKDHVSRYKFALPNVKGKIMLDVACGVGYGSQILAQSGCKKVVGLDISSQAISYANKHYLQNNTNFICSDAVRMPFKNKSFDSVVSFETIEHLKTPDLFVKEISRVIKKRGLLIISTPNGRFKNIFVNKYHYDEYTIDAIITMLQPFFRNIQIFGQQEVLLGYIKIVNWLLDKIKDVKIKWFFRCLLLYFYRNSKVVRISKNKLKEPFTYIIKAIRI